MFEVEFQTLISVDVSCLVENFSEKFKCNFIYIALHEMAKAEFLSGFNFPRISEFLNKTNSGTWDKEIYTECLQMKGHIKILQGQILSKIIEIKWVHDYR